MTSEQCSGCGVPVDGRDDGHFRTVEMDRYGERLWCPEEGAAASVVVGGAAGVELIIDTREPRIQICEYLADMDTEHFDFRAQKLDNKADFTIEIGDNVLGIQRKTCNDMVSSLDTLKDDLSELRHYHDLSALLIEGDYRLAGSTVGLRRGNKVVQTVSTKTWQNFIISQQLRGTLYIRTSELRETCQTLSHLAEYIGGPMSPPRDEIEHPHVLFQFLPGIGPETALNIGEEGSAVDALAGVDWQEVDGIGPKTEEHIVEWLEGET